MRLAVVAVLACCCLLASPPSRAGSGKPALAFPGAVGFGATSEGGRGGDVFRVTSLADDGPGTLREGVESANGPRTIVFETSGIIDLDSALRIRRQSRLTIAGQTAAGGVTLRGYPVEVVDSRHVVLRYLRFRLGDIHAAGVPGKPGNGNADLLGDAGDALTIIRCDQVIVDHVSASWSMDETLSVTKSTNVTVQNSIVSESLYDSFHSEGVHGRGSLVRGEGERGYTFFQNLWAHHNRRSPSLGGQQDDPPPGVPGLGLDVDLVGNVVYDWGLLATHTLANPFTLRINMIGNSYVEGPSQVLRFVFAQFEGTAEDVNLFRQDNWLDEEPDGTFAPRPTTDRDFFGAYTFVSEPFDFDRPRVPISTAEDHYERVLAGSGASHARDEVDLRIVDEVRTATGRIIDSQEEVGGWPAPIEVGPPPVDDDRDGMADSWERRKGLDPTDPEDRNTRRRPDGYTALDVYLHTLTGTPWTP